jgi:hypothetical protein
MSTAPSCRAAPVPFYLRKAQEEGSVMDLKDFIQSAVSQIVEGVLAAQAVAAVHGATLNPVADANARSKASPTGHVAAGAPVTTIAFDVAVVAPEGPATENGGSLRVAGAGSAKAGADTDGKGEQVTRLQFSLPIALPEARPRRSAASALDSEFLQTVNNGDSTWLPS